MNPMDWQEQVLPEDLQEIEQMLRAAPPPAPPALFERITASREIAVVVERMLLTDDPFAKRSQQYRTLISIAASALLMVGAFSVWRYVDSRTPSRANVSKTPRVAAANQGARLPKMVAAPDAPLDELARLLQPWPSTAYAMYPQRDDRIRAHGAVLDPAASARLVPSVAMYRRMLSDQRDRLLGEKRISVGVSFAANRGHRQLYLTTEEVRVGGSIALSDSIVLDAKTLLPEQRRLHDEKINRYYRLTPFELVGTDTLPELLFDDSVLGANQRAARGNASLYWNKKLNPRHPLILSESHLAVLLRTYPLWIGWRMTVDVISSMQDRSGGKTGSGSLNLRVVGMDTLTYGASREPSYRVELDFGGRPDIWWINARSGELMRSERSTSTTKEISVLMLTTTTR